KLAAAGVAEAAGLDLPANKRGREGAPRLAGRRIAPPDDIPPLVEAHGEPLRRIFPLSERPPAVLVARPGDIARSLPGAGLAADADLRVGRGEMVARRVVILAHAGRMALRAHEIPVLIQLGPMQDVVVLDLLVRVEMEPALAALLLGPAVPGDRQRLQTA